MKLLIPILTMASALTLPSSAVEIIAHRGYSHIAPENTLAAFNLAWAKGADACELDLYLTADNKVVVIHDKDTKRVAGVQKTIATSTYEDLRSLDVGSWKGARWAGEKLPTLEQALATMPVGSQRFFLEIKCGAEVVPFLRQVLEPMQKRSSQLAVISFGRAAAAETKKAMPWLKVYRIAAGRTKDKKPRTDLPQLIADTKEDRLDGLDLGADWAWDEAMVKQVRDAGLALYVWTVNDPLKVALYSRMGVDGITTDDPVMLREALARP